MDDALGALDAAAADYTATKTAHDDATQAMTAAAVAALRAGYTPADVAARLPWTDRHVRQLGRAAGIAPATRGPKRQTAPASPTSDPG